MKVGGAGVIAHGGVDERRAFEAVGEFVEQSTTRGECVVEAALVDQVEHGVREIVEPVVFEDHRVGAVGGRERPREGGGASGGCGVGADLGVAARGGEVTAPLVLLPLTADVHHLTIRAGAGGGGTCPRDSPHACPTPPNALFHASITAIAATWLAPAKCRVCP